MRKKKTLKIVLKGLILLVLGGIIINMSEDKIIYSNDPLIKNLQEKYPDNKKVKEIIEHIDEYPRELVSVLQHYEESVDYVYQYPTHQHYDVIPWNESDFDRDIPLFIQWDLRWGCDDYAGGMIGLNGCGPTALSMVIVGLTGNRSYDPRSVAQFSYENNYYLDGVGTKWLLMSEGATHFGITGIQIGTDQASVLQALNQNHPVILSVGPGDFTPTGHFIVLTGIDFDGKIIINDPNSRIKSEQTWDIERLCQQAVGAWEFYR